MCTSQFKCNVMSENGDRTGLWTGLQENGVVMPSMSAQATLKITETVQSCEGRYTGRRKGGCNDGCNGVRKCGMLPGV